MTENTNEDDSPVPFSDSDSDNSVVDELLPDFERPYTVPRPPCDACETNRHDGLYDVDLADGDYSICDECCEHIADQIERYYWWDRLSEAHYDRAAEFLRSLDEVWCVKDHAYQGGEMWVHTPVCNAAVVNDVCEHFGFHIQWFSIVEPADGEFDCVDDHGPCIEINLDYNNRIREPFPLEYDIEEDRTYYDLEWVEDDDRLFERDD